MYGFCFSLFITMTASGRLGLVENLQVTCSHLGRYPATLPLRSIVLDTRTFNPHCPLIAMPVSPYRLGKKFWSRLSLWRSEVLNTAFPTILHSILKSSVALSCLLVLSLSQFFFTGRNQYTQIPASFQVESPSAR
jgi:hypothetical protein